MSLLSEKSLVYDEEADAVRVSKEEMAEHTFKSMHPIADKVLQEDGTVVPLPSGDGTSMESFSVEINHNLQAAPLEKIIEPTRSWIPRVFSANFSSTAERILELFIVDKTTSEDFLIYSFTGDDPVDQKTALSIWFSQFGTYGKLSNNFALKIKATQTADPCVITGFFSYEK